jgi:ribosomal protein L37AE/L43A
MDTEHQPEEQEEAIHCPSCKKEVDAEHARIGRCNNCGLAMRAPLRMHYAEVGGMPLRNRGRVIL